VRWNVLRLPFQSKVKQTGQTVHRLLSRNAVDILLKREYPALTVTCQEEMK
jgi:hypothetical protein